MFIQIKLIALLILCTLLSTPMHGALTLASQNSAFIATLTADFDDYKHILAISSSPQRYHYDTNGVLTQYIDFEDGIFRKLSETHMTLYAIGGLFRDSNTVYMYLSCRKSINDDFPSFKQVKSFSITNGESVSSFTLSQVGNYVTYSIADSNPHADLFLEKITLKNDGTYTLTDSIEVQSDSPQSKFEAALTTTGLYLLYSVRIDNLRFNIKMFDIVNQQKTQFPKQSDTIAFGCNLQEDNLLIGIQGTAGYSLYSHKQSLYIFENKPISIPITIKIMITMDGVYSIVQGETQLMVFKHQGGTVDIGTVNYSPTSPLFVTYLLVESTIKFFPRSDTQFIALPAQDIYQFPVEKIPLICDLSTASTSKILFQSQCQCLLKYSWDPKLLKCVANCKTRFAVRAIQNHLACQCEEGAVWDENYRGCLLDCPNIPYSTGQIITQQICECDSYHEWNPRTLKCDPKCISQQLSTGTLLDSGQCECVDKAIWRSNNGRCERDCTQYIHSKYQKPNLMGQCTCQSGFKWNNEECQLIECSAIAYTDAQSSHPQQKQGICDCQPSFNWDSSLTECILDCTAIAGNLHLFMNQGNHACQCKSGAIWERAALMCFIDCSQVAYALQENVNANECKCEDHFYWDMNQCKTVCGEKIGQLTTFNEVKNHCDCVPGFQFYHNSPEGGACYRVCGQIEYTIGYFGLTPSSCTCEPGFIWNQKDSICELACDGPYDTGVSANPAVCSCLGTTVFSSGFGKCIPICRDDPLSNGFFNNDTFGCSCKVNAYWAKSLALCDCNSGFSYDDQKKACLQTTSGALVVPLSVAGALISGALVAIVMKKRIKSRENKDFNDIVLSESDERIQKA